MRFFQKRRGIYQILRLGCVIVVGLILAMPPPLPNLASPTQAQSPLPGGPFIGAAVEPRSFDGDLTRLPRAPSTHQPRVFPLRGRGSSSQPRGEQPSSESNLPAQTKSNMPSPTQNFSGIGFTLAGWPPDPNGDVGPNHYIQAVNISFAIYSKTGTLLAGPTSFNSFWAGANTNTPCDNQHNGDPIVLYDTLADRWLLTDFAFPVDFFSGAPGPPFYQCIAVSKTSNPVSGGWYLYAIQADPNLLNDYPKFGLWSDAYYMTANMYDLSFNNVFVRVWALDRNSMLTGGTLKQVHFDLPLCAARDAVCPHYSLLPSNLRGTVPPAGSPNYLANIETANTPAGIPFSSNVIHLWKFHVDWNNPLNSTLTGPTNLTVASFTQPLAASGDKITMDLVPQKGTTTRLDTLGDRLMMSAQYRSLASAGTQSLWLTHTINHGSVTAVRWYEIRIAANSFSLFQQGTFDPGDGNFRWMPSLAVDQKGNMAVGYSVSGSSINPGIRYAGRLSTDPLNQLSQGEGTLVDGSGSQTSFPFIGAITRWGDYSAMSIDPTDDCTFWYTNEYYTADGFSWATRIGSFKMPACSGTPLPSSLRYYFPFASKGN